MDLDPGAPFAQPLLREGGDGGRMFVQIERLSSLAAAGLLAAVLSGCGDGGGGSPPVPPPSDPPPDVPPVPPESGVRSRGGELPEPRRPGGRVSWETVEYRRSNGLALIDASGGARGPRRGPARRRGHHRGGAGRRGRLLASRSGARPVRRGDHVSERPIVSRARDARRGHCRRASRRLRRARRCLEREPAERRDLRNRRRVRGARRGRGLRRRRRGLHRVRGGSGADLRGRVV